MLDMLRVSDVEVDTLRVSDVEVDILGVCDVVIGCVNVVGREVVEVLKYWRTKPTPLFWMRRVCVPVPREENSARVPATLGVDTETSVAVKVDCPSIA